MSFSYNGDNSPLGYVCDLEGKRIFYDVETGKPATGPCEVTMKLIKNDIVVTYDTGWFCMKGSACLYYAHDILAIDTAFNINPSYESGWYEDLACQFVINSESEAVLINLLERIERKELKPTRYYFSADTTYDQTDTTISDDDDDEEVITHEEQHKSLGIDDDVIIYEGQYESLGVVVDQNGDAVLYAPGTRTKSQSSNAVPLNVYNDFCIYSRMRKGVERIYVKGDATRWFTRYFKGAASLPDDRYLNGKYNTNANEKYWVFKNNAYDKIMSFVSFVENGTIKPQHWAKKFMLMPEKKSKKKTKKKKGSFSQEKKSPSTRNFEIFVTYPHVGSTIRIDYTEDGEDKTQMCIVDTVDQDRCIINISFADDQTILAKLHYVIGKEWQVFAFPCQNHVKFM